MDPETGGHHAVLVDEDETRGTRVGDRHLDARLLPLVVHEEVRVLAAVTAVYWPIRVVQIALADHDAAFVVVHTVLGVVSVALAVWAWASTTAARPSKATSGLAV